MGTFFDLTYENINDIFIENVTEFTVESNDKFQIVSLNLNSEKRIELKDGATQELFVYDGSGYSKRNNIAGYVKKDDKLVLNPSDKYTLVSSYEGLKIVMKVYPPVYDPLLRK